MSNLIYKNPITIRQDHLTCPLPLALESYWSCAADCLHCMGRRLNQIWGQEQRCTNPEAVRKTLINALSNKNPKSIIAQALHAQKTFFLGRKADPYQPIELKERITAQLIEILFELDWSFAICSRYQANLIQDIALLKQKKHLVTILTELTPGGDADWELFERGRTTPPKERLSVSQRLQRYGFNVGVRGEPFIPGYHTFAQFRDTLKMLKSYGIKSYNTYSLHINEYTIKRLFEIGLDIEKIWELNHDKHWKPIQRKLCDIAEQEGIILGCPDFVNVRKDYSCPANTCCGVSVPKPFTFNTHHWRNDLVAGENKSTILVSTWEGIGTIDDQSKGCSILCSKEEQDYYTFNDAEL